MNKDHQEKMQKVLDLIKELECVMSQKNMLSKTKVVLTTSLMFSDYTINWETYKLEKNGVEQSRDKI